MSIIVNGGVGCLTGIGIGAFTAGVIAVGASS